MARQGLPVCENVFDVDEEPIEGKISEPITIYNLTTDPNRTTNLYSSKSGTTINLTSSQTGSLEVNYLFQPPVFITSDEYFFPSTRPAIIIFSSRVFHDDAVRATGLVTEVRWTDKLARIRNEPTLERFTVNFICQDYRKVRVLSVADGLDRIIQKGYIIDSEQTGEHFLVIDSTRDTVQDIDLRDLKSVKTTVPFAARRWLETIDGTYSEVGLVEEIHVNARPSTRNFETFIIT